jgi:hypothetical protein
MAGQSRRGRGEGKGIGDEMPIIKFKPEDSYSINDPYKSRITTMSIELAVDCNGTCDGGKASFNFETWEIESQMPPHFHLVVRGEDPKAGPLYIAVKKGL